MKNIPALKLTSGCTFKMCPTTTKWKQHSRQHRKNIKRKVNDYKLHFKSAKLV